MGSLEGARQTVVIDVSVALVRACSVLLLMAEKIHHLSTPAPSSFLVGLVLVPSYFRLLLLLCSHSTASRVFVKVLQLQVRSQFLVGRGSHSKASRAFAEAGVIRAYPRILVVPCRVFVEVAMLPASPRSLGSLCSHSKAYRVSVGAGKFPAALLFRPPLCAHLEVVLSSSGF